MQQVASNAARKLSSRVLRAPIFLQQSERFFFISDVDQSQNSSSSSPWQQNQRSFFSSGTSDVSVYYWNTTGITTGIRFPQNHLGHLGRACYSSSEAASSSDELPSDDVKEVYDKMLKSVEGGNNASKCFVVVIDRQVFE